MFLDLNDFLSPNEIHLFFCFDFILLFIVFFIQAEHI